MSLSRLRDALAGLVRHDAVPEIRALSIGRARVVSQGIDGRVSLQRVNRDGEYPDLFGSDNEGRVALWCGVAGVSVDPTPSQEVLFGFAAADLSDPIAFVATPLGQPGHVPIKVRHEATTEIRFVGASAGFVRVGPGATQQVALGPALDSVIAALQTFATTLGGSTDPAVMAAASALSSALGAIAVTKAIRLEAI